MNIFDNLDFSTDAEVVSDIFQDAAAGFRVERILSSGQTSEIYEQDEDEFVLLLEGEARLLIWDEVEREVLLKKGDSLWIPAHQRHQVSYTSESCIWLCVFAKREVVEGND